jgi:methionyl-tRNA formyltransferase
MLLEERIAIADNDTTATLHDKLAELGRRQIVEPLEIGACGGLDPQPQPAEGVTYAHKIEKAEAAIDRSQPAQVVARRIRAFDPAPGAGSVLDGEALKNWAARALPGEAARSVPGQIEQAGADGIDVSCGEGVLRITQLQRAGGKRLPAADFLRGFELKPGMTFERPERPGRLEP